MSKEITDQQPRSSLSKKITGLVATALILAFSWGLIIVLYMGGGTGYSIYSSDALHIFSYIIIVALFSLLAIYYELKITWGKVAAINAILLLVILYSFPLAAFGVFFLLANV